MKLTPERGINIVCLAITAIAPTLAIGLVIGSLTGLAAALGLVAVMQGQASPVATERRQAYAGAWLIRSFVLCIEQMAYQDQFDSRASLPFGFSPVFWSWAAVVFMAALDLWAYYRTATRAAAAAERADIEASLARAGAHDQAERAARLERERLAKDERLELARIKAEAKAAAAIAAEETRRKEVEEARKIEEAKWKAEETARNFEETKWKAEEERRKSAELGRKEAERLRKEEECAKKAEEAEQKRLEEEKQEKLREKWRQQKQNKKINHHQPETAQNVEA